jgi:nitrite reductase/ring-hydroxylating ferredoxin subunit
MSTGSGGFNRRTFLQNSMLLGGVAPFCCTTPAAPPESVSFEGATLVLDLRRIPDLRAVGSACAVVDAGRKVNIIVARSDSRHYVALDRSCTHGGAQCTYVHRRCRLRCTSLNHAEYELDGTLLHGRTHGNLRAYSVRLDGARLRIALEEKA